MVSPARVDDLALGTLCPGVRNPLIAYLHLAHSFARAPTSGDEAVTGQEMLSDLPNQPPAEVAKAELKRRAGIKFRSPAQQVQS